MFFACSGKTRGEFEELCKKICGKGDSVVFYASGLELLQKIVVNPRRTDLILLDYEFYKGFANLIFDVLKSRDIKIPVIMIGKTLANKKLCTEVWIAENEFRYDVQNFHMLRPVLDRISLAFSSIEEKMPDEISPSLKTEDLRLASREENPIEEMHKKSILPPSIYNLLSFLYKNRLREISLDEIEKHLHVESESDKIRKNTVYAYIARARNCIEREPLCQLQLLRTRKGYYRLIHR